MLSIDFKDTNALPASAQCHSVFLLVILKKKDYIFRESFSTTLMEIDK